jgi:hypothetical protein
MEFLTRRRHNMEIFHKESYVLNETAIESIVIHFVVCRLLDAAYSITERPHCQHMLHLVKCE